MGGSHGLGKVFALESLLRQSCDSPKEDSMYFMDLMMHKVLCDSISLLKGIVNLVGPCIG